MVIHNLASACECWNFPWFHPKCLGEVLSCWLIPCLNSPGNWGVNQLKIITSDRFLCSLDCLWDSQPLKWEIWDLYIKCLFKTLYKWGNVIELKPRWGVGWFQWHCVNSASDEAFTLPSCWKADAFATWGMEDGFGEHLMGVIPGVCKAWAVGMILCNPWLALALCSNRLLWWFVPAQVFFNKFPANHQRGEMELWGWVSGWACTSRCAPLEAGSWGCYLGREMEMSPAPRCLGGEIPFQGSSFWQQGAFNDHVDLPGENRGRMCV